MKKVDFHKISIETITGEPATVDVHQVLGDFIFNQAEHVDEHDLGRDIYHSEGEMDLTDAQCEIVRKAASKMKYILRTALEKAVES